MSESDRIRRLAISLREALEAAYVSDREPPYTVPYRIDCDLFKFTRAETRDEAMALIREAVERTSGGML